MLLLLLLAQGFLLLLHGSHRQVEIGAQGQETYFRGFGGAHFTIKFHDGTVIETTNLWCQGDIDKEWKHCFPDNADFDWKWEKVGGSEILVEK